MHDKERGDDHHSKQHTLRRKPLRLQNCDYSQPGYYFITICTQNRKPWLGNIVNNQMELNNIGHVVQTEWVSLPNRCPGVELDQFVIMPNHMHGILILTENTRYHHTQKRLKPTVSNIIDSFKGAATYRIHKTVAPEFAWQKSFYDSIIRNHPMLDAIRHYIVDNPARWSLDKLYENDLSPL
jgi:putative transposase